jgi:hypothetical protein
MKGARVTPANWSLEVALTYFFDLGRLQRIIEKKLDIRSSESFDNNAEKILDNHVLKGYFQFLCELMMSRGRSLAAMRTIVEKVRDIRSILLVVSKIPSCSKYLRFLYSCVFNVIGNSYQALVGMLFINPIVKKPVQEYPSSLLPSEPESALNSKDRTDGEELLLLLVKILVVGKGKPLNQAK